jgi:DHA1 family tetracycline resistance protein-like MFS transporter
MGPYIGGKLADPSVVSWFSASTPFWFAAILGALNWLAVVFFLPETNTKLQSQLRLNILQSFINIREALRTAQLRSLFSVGFFFQGGFTFFTTFAATYFITKFGFSGSQIGDYYAFIGLWIAISQAVVTRLVSKRFSSKQALSVSILGVALALLGYTLYTERWQLYVFVPFFAIFIGLTQANTLALVSQSAEPSEQGKVLGVNSSVQALAQGIPAALSGYIAASIGVTAPIYWAAGTVALGGIIFLATIGLRKTDATAMPTAGAQ